MAGPDEPARRGLSRRHVLAAASALAATVVLPADRALGQERQLPGLASAARSGGLRYGAAASYGGRGGIGGDADFEAAFAREAGQLVCENEMKWAALRPGPGVFDFSVADRMVAWARARSLAVRGHNLCWHAFNPPWLVASIDMANAERLLTDHVGAVAGHYRGRLTSWDVVNEAVDVGQGRADGLRTDSLWMRSLGPAYLDLAFHAARSADPDVLLVYNDYGLELDTGPAAARRAAVLRLLAGLRDRGAPVGALGMQSHLRAADVQAHFRPQVLRRFLADVAGLGLTVLVTELDVADDGLPGAPRLRDAAVADAYAAVLPVLLDEPAVTEVLTWGISDRRTWISLVAPRADGRPVRPLPLDAALARKPAWRVLAAALRAAPPRPGQPAATPATDRLSTPTTPGFPADRPGG